MMNWLFYTVPEEQGFNYLFKIIIWLLIMPSLLGLQLTSLGVLFIYLTVDIVFYLSLRTN